MFAALFFTADANALDITKSVDVHFDDITRDALWDMSSYDLDIDLSDALVVTDRDFDLTTIVISEDAALSADFSGLSIAGSTSVSATSASASFTGYASGPGYSSISVSSYSYTGDSGSFASVTGSVENASDTLSIDLFESSSDELDIDLDIDLVDDFTEAWAGVSADLNERIRSLSDTLSVDLSTPAFDSAIDLTLDEDVAFDASTVEIIYVESGETLDFGDYSVTAE